jgi:DNA-directed RNA polymerase sigma subunit (sigma70/sigma32)
MGVKRNADRDFAIWRERKEKGTTLEALAKKYSITRERVRQIVARQDQQIYGASHGG